MSSNEAVSAENHAYKLGVDTADTVQLNTHVQQNIGAQRFLRGDTPGDDSEERSNVEEMAEEFAKVVLKDSGAGISKSFWNDHPKARKAYEEALKSTSNIDIDKALAPKKGIKKPTSKKLGN
ncbi:hypothetical protein KXD40_003590 [Peronospora effusa]|uniref:RxLR effector protein n=1 Tax=Peronospora effusa TaxID=542832 RepID=A0A3M6VKQ4_9STRA|nr:hypothetical protein DD238_001272 [Peronospora effusa]RQM17526.1 hypothetical protein DD237_001953 [Peronospora effusa]UIZ23029.1 hypothetical protein KXD40_003590 [Peronospora effusa]CAI5729485.1 unnamed protein product [Peronospora effusa]